MFMSIDVSYDHYYIRSYSHREGMCPGAYPPISDDLMGVMEK